MMALRIARLCRLHGLDETRAAVLALLIWGAGHD